MEVNLWDDFLSLINLSLAHVYYNTMLSNHGLIGLKDSSRKLVASYVISLYLILHTCV